MNNWKQSFIQIFGKKCKKSWKVAAIDIQLVDSNIKAACLFDLWLASAEEMAILIKHLGENGLIKNTLAVTSLGSDIIVFSPLALVSFLEHNLPDTQFVDITSTMPVPLLMPKQKAQMTIETFSQFVYKVSQSSEMCTVLDFDQGGELNIPCLFGLFLGYPCVYWYNNNMDNGNCLTDQHLVLFQVIGHLSERPQEDQIPCLSHTIYSFSVPLNLIEVLRPVVDKWFNGWKEDQNWSGLFSSISLKTETVNPEIVCL